MEHWPVGATLFDSQSKRFYRVISTTQDIRPAHMTIHQLKPKYAYIYIAPRNYTSFNRYGPRYTNGNASTSRIYFTRRFIAYALPGRTVDPHTRPVSLFRLRRDHGRQVTLRSVRDRRILGTTRITLRLWDGNVAPSRVFGDRSGTAEIPSIAIIDPKIMKPTRTRTDGFTMEDAASCRDYLTQATPEQRREIKALRERNKTLEQTSFNRVLDTFLRDDQEKLVARRNFLGLINAARNHIRRRRNVGRARNEFVRRAREEVGNHLQTYENYVYRPGGELAQLAVRRARNIARQ